MRTRIRLAISTAALAAGAALFIATPGAIATQDQPVIAGQVNTATTKTVVKDTNWTPTDCEAASSDIHWGLIGCGEVGVRGKGTDGGVWGFALGTGVRGFGDTGVEGFGGPTGVYGSGSTTGVEGLASSGGTGVYGHNSGSTGIGVHGQTGGTGSAVFGEATANGVGLYGTSVGGVGVQGLSSAADGTALKATALNGNYAKAVWGVSNNGFGGYFESPGSVGFGVYAKGGEFGVRADGPVGTYSTGTKTGVDGSSTTGSGVYGHATSGIGVNAYANGGVALQVQGRAKFSRSGTVIVDATKASKTVTLSGVTTNSMILAIAQQNGSVFVKATVPAAGSFTIYLTGNAPAGGLKVAYFVLN